MDHTANSDRFAGLSGLNIAADRHELGEGIELRPTHARCISAFAIDTTKTESARLSMRMLPYGQSFDISSEILVPEASAESATARQEIARVLVFLLRLVVNPETNLTAFSDTAFERVAKGGLGENPKVWPVEIEPRFLQFTAHQGDTHASYWFAWVSRNWRKTSELYRGSTEFALAVDAMNSMHFIANSALCLISAWGAIEAIFSPSTTELKFRISSLLSAYLKPPGKERQELQKKVGKLYDKRSAAAHGKPKHTAADLAATYNLLADALVKIIEDGEVPVRHELEGRLFGNEKTP